MTDFNTPGAGSWVATFTGNALITCWGGGGGGESGAALARGGAGGGGGAMAYDTVFVTTGVTYSYVVGSGGAGGVWSSGNGGAGTDSTFGSTVLIRGAGGGGGNTGAGGAGGTEAASHGSSTFPGVNGRPYPSGTYDGAPGGAGGGAEGGAGGAPGINGGALAGTAGANPGGGGGGGQQASGGNGGAGGNGRVRIVPAPTTVPGYHVDTAVTPGTVGWTAPADGTVIVETYGGGGGGKGGVALGYAGSGGGGGGYSYKAVAVRKDATYSRVVGVAGTGSTWNAGAGGNGGDSSFSLAPAAIVSKTITGGNTATLKTAGVHGYFVGDSVVVTGVDSTFNGTYTVTAIPDSIHFSYTKVAANLGATTTSGSSSLAQPVLVLAKAGTGATGTTTGQGVGGDAAAGIGSTKNSGASGLPALTTSNDGGNGGRGALPNGGLGGAAGSISGSGVAGKPGNAPGGAGGGGSNNSGGDGGVGSAGSVTVSYYLTFGSVIEGGLEKYIVALTYKDTLGAVHPITAASRISSGARVSLLKTRPDLTAGTRTPPSYMPTGLTSSSAPRNPSVAYSTLFDVHRGTLNYSTPNLDAALAAGYAEILIIGDSVAEGWTHLDTLPPYNHTADFPNAWPRIMASSLVASTGKSHGGTGMVRPGSAASSFDPEWAQGGWSASGIHFIASSTTTQTATFTANYAGTGIAVAMAGTGTAEVTIDGVVVGTTTAGGSATAVTRTTFTGLSNAKHAVGLRPVSGTAQCLGVDVYTPGTGIRVHNMSQGGATASGTGQAAWADSSSGSPANMLPAYDQTTPMFGRAPHAVIICVGGNDVHADITPAVIAAAHDTIGTAFTASGTDIILLPDAHGSNVFHADSYNTCKPEWTALMQLAVNKGWSYIDFDWLTGGFDGLAGHNPPYTGDDFGHLNVAGAAFFGNLMTRVVLNT